MASGPTYNSIAYITLPSANLTSVTLGNIPQTYTDLILIFNGSATTGNFYVRVNSDSSSLYSQTSIRGTGTVAGSSRETAQAQVYIGDYVADPISTISNAVLNFNNYSNTTSNKSFLFRGNNSAKFTDITAGLWRSTAAITSITIASSSAVFASGSTFNLYGIAAA